MSTAVAFRRTLIAQERLGFLRSPIHDALRVGDERGHVPRQGERDRRTTGGLGRAVHRNSPFS